MKKRFYNATTLQKVLSRFEAAYGMTSADFYAAHLSDSETVVTIPGHHRQAWAGFHREAENMSADAFVDRVDRELEAV